MNLYIDETFIKKYLTYNKELKYRWFRLKEMLDKSGNLSTDLKYQVKNSIYNPDINRISRYDTCKEKNLVAVDFTKKFVKQNRELSITTFSKLRECFTEKRK